MHHHRLGFLALIAIVAATPSVQARAEGVNIYQATLGETDQRTQDISTEEMRRIISDGSAIVLDARPPAEFVNGHIPGANVIEGPPEDAMAAVDRLVDGDKTKALVLYCNGPFCGASRRMSDKLLDAGFTNVRRYQLGMPVWRALGGPTVVELEGVLRVFNKDQTAVFLDARSPDEFAQQTLFGARNLTPENAPSVGGDVMPIDDFDTRIVVFGSDGEQARALADALSKRPWHNVAYYPGSFESLASALKAK